MARKASVIKHVTTGSVLDDLNFPPEVLAELKLRAQLHADVYEIASQYTQLELQNIWKESQPRVSDFMRGKVSKFSIERLLRYAAQLGSDCPFFLLNQPCLGQGRGELLEPLRLDLSGYSFLLIHPGIHISTAESFSRCRPDDSSLPLRSIIGQPVTMWRHTLTNDFEASLFAQYPVLREIKQSLYDHGALYSAMTGSGSCLYGIFEKGRVPAFPDGRKNEYLAIN